MLYPAASEQSLIGGRKRCYAVSNSAIVAINIASNASATAPVSIHPVLIDLIFRVQSNNCWPLPHEGH